MDPVTITIAVIVLIPAAILFAGFLYGSYLQYVKGEDIINE